MIMTHYYDNEIYFSAVFVLTSQNEGKNSYFLDFKLFKTTGLFWEIVWTITKVTQPEIILTKGTLKIIYNCNFSTFHPTYPQLII